ncbi:MAG: hypothetical protein RLZZ58_1105, partial [Pseudomonadota bacterium]
MRILFLAAALCAAAPLTACAADGAAEAEAAKSAVVTIATGAAQHRFRVEVARTPE